MGIDEFVDLDLDEFQRRANDRLLGLVDRHRAAIEADLGAAFDAQERNGRIELLVDGQPFYLATTTAAGRLLLTDISGRYSGWL